MFNKKDDIYEHVINAYSDNDVELNKNFFDFKVNLDVYDILNVYKELQQSINGDVVLCMKDVRLEKDGDNPIISGIEEKEIDTNLIKRNFTGNMKELLEIFDENTEKTGIYRLTNIQSIEGGRIAGTPLALI